MKFFAQNKRNKIKRKRNLIKKKYFPMEKNMQYFPHDINSRQDIKIKKLTFQYGMTGYGVYWALIEDLYANKNNIPIDYDLFAHALRVDVDLIRAVTHNFDLFTIQGNMLSSKGITTRLSNLPFLTKMKLGIDSGNAEPVSTYKPVRRRVEDISESEYVEIVSGTSQGEKKKDVNSFGSFGLDSKFTISKFDQFWKAFDLPNEYKRVLFNWFEYKAGRQQSYATVKSARTCGRSLVKLSGGSISVARKIVNRSIMNNYSGLFEWKTTAFNDKQVAGSFRNLKATKPGHAYRDDGEI
jgi:hypothetical protein